MNIRSPRIGLFVFCICMGDIITSGGDQRRSHKRFSRQVPCQKKRVLFIKYNFGFMSEILIGLDRDGNKNI